MTPCRTEEDGTRYNDCAQCGKEYPIPADGYTLGYCDDCLGQSWK